MFLRVFKAFKSALALRPFDRLMALSKRKCVEGQAQAPSFVEGMRGSTEEATGLSAIAGREALAKAEAYTRTYVRISEGR